MAGEKFRGIRTAKVINSVEDLVAHSYKRVATDEEKDLSKGAPAKEEPDPEVAEAEDEEVTPKTQSSTGDDFDAMTYDELYDLAVKLDIDGRSNKNKNSLIKAIRRAKKK